MSRISKAPDERRSELIDCAERLFYSKGYESTSVSDIVNEVGVAKGTFYYYFDSKLAILEAMIDDLIAQLEAIMRDIIDDETLSALQKWTLTFQVTNNWKIDRKGEMLEVLRALQSDENVILQYKMIQRMREIAAPEIAKIVRQGVAEGVFETPSHPQDAATIALAIGQHFSSSIADALLNQDNYEDPVVYVKRNLEATQTAIERILGAAEGSMPLIDEQTITIWFADQ